MDAWIDIRRKARACHREQVILGRSHLTLARITGILEQLGIPLLYLGDLFERPEIRDLLSLVALDAEYGGVGLVRVAALKPYEVPRDDALAVIRWAQTQRVTIFEALKRTAEIEAVSDAGRAGLAQLGAELDGLGPGTSPWTLLTTWLFERSDYLRPLLVANDIPSKQKLVAIYQLLKVCGEQVALGELPDTPQTRGMIAKVAHLVRVLYLPTELDHFVAAVRSEYYEPITTRIIRGDVLWAQFEEAVASCRADPKGDDRQITEKVNELAVAKVLLDDKTITGPITYEPDFLPDGRKIDFVVDRGNDNLYVEVKTVRPRTADTEAAWQKFIARRQHHPDNVNFIIEKEWMGGAIHGNLFASRAHFLDYTRDFETRLAAAKAIKPGPGVLVFCGTGFAWHKSNLEDFADFYLIGVHRGDDAFALMEQYAIKKKKIKLLRNIDHFAYLRRHTEKPQKEEFHFPIRGPRFILPPPKPLEPAAP